MLIDLLRHGTALPAAPGGDDADRVLSDEGRAQVKEVVARAREAGVKPSLILASPYARALETARIAAQILGYGGSIVPCPALEPVRPPFELWEELRARGAQSEILLAGHMPLLGDFAAWLSGDGVRIGTGTMVRIEIPALAPQPAGVVRAVIVPGTR